MDPIFPCLSRAALPMSLQSDNSQIVHPYPLPSYWSHPTGAHHYARSAVMLPHVTPQGHLDHEDIKILEERMAAHSISRRPAVHTKNHAGTWQPANKGLIKKRDNAHSAQTSRHHRPLERGFACAICKQVDNDVIVCYPDQLALDKHTKIVHGPKIFPCRYPECGARFSYSYLRKEHVQSTHTRGGRRISNAEAVARVLRGERVLTGGLFYNRERGFYRPDRAQIAAWQREAERMRSKVAPSDGEQIVKVEEIIDL